MLEQKLLELMSQYGTTNVFLVGLIVICLIFLLTIVLLTERIKQIENGDNKK